jgi:hypothetical protein
MQCGRMDGATLRMDPAARLTGREGDAAASCRVKPGNANREDVQRSGGHATY